MIFFFLFFFFGLEVILWIETYHLSFSVTLFVNLGQCIITNMALYSEGVFITGD